MNNLSLQDRIKKIIEGISKGIYEKNQIIKLSLLAALSGQNIFLFGEPGCGKSMIARRLVSAFKTENNKDNVKYFEYLMNQFSTPDELFGPYSLKALNGEVTENNPEGKESYIRITKDKLPDADIAFLDEIWKAGPAIQNTLLTIINEKKFNNGIKVLDVPLKTLFAASNELPSQNLGLEALYDRFVIRLLVTAIKDQDQFFAMIDEDASSDFKLDDEIQKLQISNDELKQWKKDIGKIKLSDDAKIVINAIRQELTLFNENLSQEELDNGEAFEVSDRRWKNIVQILKTSAFFNGRDNVDFMDCSLIENCIWGTEKQLENARNIVTKCIKENGINCDSGIQELQEQLNDFRLIINQKWFESDKDVIVNINDVECYECTKCDDSEKDNIFYISVEPQDRSYHYIYKSNQERFDYNTLSKEEDIITFQGDEYKINKKQPINYMSDIYYQSLQTFFEKEYYSPLISEINEQIKNLEAQKKEDAMPFKNNIFADQEYNNSITDKIDTAIYELNQFIVEVKKEKYRYYKEDLETISYSIGDAVLNNGIVISQNEIESLSDEDMDRIVGIVCVDNKNTYILGLTQSTLPWNQIKEFSRDYGKNYPDPWNKKWLNPNKDNLLEIWMNREIINKSLSKIPNATLLETKEYWSNTLDNSSPNKVPIYKLFDEREDIDHTTKDHSYGVIVIHGMPQL